MNFKYLQFCTKNKYQVNQQSAELFDSTLTKEQREVLCNDSVRMWMDVLMKGGIIYDKSILSFHNIEDYLEHIRIRMSMRRTNELKGWIKDRPARKFFSERKPDKKSDELLFDKMETASEIIEEYWDKGYFTEKELSKQLICITERDYGGENRIGIMVKKEPYAHQYRVTVRGIVGPYNVIIEGEGWSLELEEGSKRFSVSKSYNSFPSSKDELIDDFVSLDILENLPPKDYIFNDIGNIPIFPTSKEYFK